MNINLIYLIYHRLNFKKQLKLVKTGSMAELVDAPDSKSGHFGGVGSIKYRFTL
jgi:hypothetical protein